MSFVAQNDFNGESEKGICPSGAEYGDQLKGAAVADAPFGGAGDDIGHSDDADKLAQREWQTYPNRGRKTLALVARLHAELLQELDRLEDRNWSLQGHIKSSMQSDSRRRPDAISGPGLPGDLHAGVIAALQEEVETAGEGLDRLQGRDLEDRVIKLAGFAMELNVLLSEIESREASWGLWYGACRSSRRAAAAYRADGWTKARSRQLLREACVLFRAPPEGLAE